MSRKHIPHRIPHFVLEQTGQPWTRSAAAQKEQDCEGIDAAAAFAPALGVRALMMLRERQSAGTVGVAQARSEISSVKGFTMAEHRDTPWAPYRDLFDEAVAFAVFSLANEDIGFLAMDRRRSMVEVFGLLGEEINEASAQGGGVDPFIVRYYVQQIIDRATFPEDDQPPVHYQDMADPPADPDLRVFTWQPRPGHRPRQESHEDDIAYVVGEVAGRFGLNNHASADRKPDAPKRRPSAVEVVAEALRRATDGRRGSVSSVRACLTPDTAERYAEGLKEGRAQRAASEGGKPEPDEDCQ